MKLILWTLSQYRNISEVWDGEWAGEATGPKIQGNPYDYAGPELKRHGRLEITPPADFEGIKAYLGTHWMEGIVWWKDGEPIAKIKRVDFGIPWLIDQLENIAGLLGECTSKKRASENRAAIESIFKTYNP